MEKKSLEDSEIDKKLRKEEVQFFRKTNQQLKAQIESILTLK